VDADASEKRSKVDLDDAPDGDDTEVANELLFLLSGRC
jgi:hypothetical protein